MQVQQSLNSAMIRQEAVQLLQRLISIPSFSKEEQGTASCLSQWFLSKGIEVNRHKNNVWAYNRYFDKNKPTLLLNSHHDTVKPASGYTKDPFSALIENNKLFGLGSNDAGGALVALIATFLHFYEQKGLPYNIVLASTAEEEISGKDGVESILPMLGSIDCAIVGEPTLMNMAIAERGLMVLDCESKGVAGHAARNEGENAIYKALNDVTWIKGYQFNKVSELLGSVKMTVTVVETENKAHNVVPASCRFVVDVRVNELYSFDEVINVMSANMHSVITPRSMRLRSSIIEPRHPLVKAGLALNRKYYGSPTNSDKALMIFPALKMGPGDSARSHTADEYIYIDELEEGIDIYIQLLNKFFASVKV